MGNKKGISEIVREHKTLFIIIAVALFLLELEIFAVAVMKSGRKSMMRIMDHNGNVVHETDGKNLSEFNKYYFEKTFGPFENYEVKLVTKDNPFPFRAWFVAAVGLPVGIVLLFAFVVKAYLALFYGHEKDEPRIGSSSADYDSRLEMVIDKLSRFNIFTLGFLIFLAIFAYWVVPNMVTYLGKIGMETLTRYKWFFIVAAALFFVLAVWIIYLRYLLASKAIESRTEVEKHRLELEMAHQASPPQLEYNNSASRTEGMDTESREN